MPRRKPAALRLLRPAEEDRTDIYDYIAADNPSAAERLLLRIEGRLHTLARQAMLGPVPRDPDIAQLGYRYLIIGEYLVFYKIEGSQIFVHRILHGSRDYSEIL